jgi:sulfate transport system ATP-binding protein
MSGVVVKDLQKHFVAGGAPAIDGVSFAAPPGAVTALIGPSGAGKSTVLRIVAGLEQADRGAVILDGTDVTALPPQQRGVGLVFQSYALFEHMSVAENIAFGLKVRKVPQPIIHERVRAMLALVQLEGAAQRRPAELSGGQRQRIAFARALAIEPKVLLLDEPFGALDAVVRRELREWLVKLHEQTRTTTLLVTHDQEEALEVSQHVVVLLDGKVAQAGEPAEVYDRPNTPATASFLGRSSLKGLVAGGRANLGSLQVDVPHGRDGERVEAFVLPQDVRLTRAPSDQVKDARYGQVERMKIVGARVKVALTLASTGERVHVEVGRDEIDALGLSPGDHVLLDVKSARVFLNDFAI